MSELGERRITQTAGGAVALAGLALLAGVN
jgi:hypothetical protein